MDKTYFTNNESARKTGFTNNQSALEQLTKSPETSVMKGTKPKEKLKSQVNPYSTIHIFS